MKTVTAVFEFVIFEGAWGMLKKAFRRDTAESLKAVCSADYIPRIREASRK